ncbi:hypothetical protein AeRB84_020660 [Aphanomyces euteiches]|nr:hypothetical protein AeRB84_020660 [Aphanomyces euteiches]
MLKSRLYLSVFESRLERELLESKEKIASFANVSRELARSQREVRDLYRRQSIQSMLKISPAHKANPPLKAKAGGILGLQDKHLLIIFAFVGARDVLAISLTCHSWRSRIHTLFGLETKPSPASAAPKTQPLKLKPAPVLDKAQLAKADEMMKSFNAKEMKLFHDLVVRLKGLEANMVSLQAEKEDLAARLQGAENVRDFLMDKLTDAEDALTFSLGEKAKVEAQSSLDREVMAYLDSKAQDLEAVAQSYAVQNEELKVELDRLQREHDAKSQVIEDMIRHLTAEKNDIELQSKAQKKVLVKEVRTLRAENARLAMECNGYRAQLKQLKSSLMSLETFDTNF